MCIQEAKLYSVIFPSSLVVLFKKRKKMWPFNITINQFIILCIIFLIIYSLCSQIIALYKRICSENINAVFLIKDAYCIKNIFAIIFYIIMLHPKYQFTKTLNFKIKFKIAGNLETWSTKFFPQKWKLY